MARQIGLRDIHIALLTKDDNTGATYATPTKLERAISAKLSPKVNSEVIANCQLAKDVLCDCSEIDTKIAELQKEIDTITKQSRKAIQENARIAQSQDEFNKQINGYRERHRLVLDQINELEDQKRERQNRSLVLDNLIKELSSRPLAIDEFDERLWMVAVERVVVTGVMVEWSLG